MGRDDRLIVRECTASDAMRTRCGSVLVDGGCVNDGLARALAGNTGRSVQAQHRGGGFACEKGIIRWGIG